VVDPSLIHADCFILKSIFIMVQLQMIFADFQVLILSASLLVTSGSV
jgi:hypothetical protein